MAKVALGCDHAGFHLKEFIKKHLEERRYNIVDHGCFDTESTDYPDYAVKVAHTVAEDPKNRGILVCGTGIGMSIAANKVRGIRAALCHNEFEAQMCREHNDANIVCLGARVLKMQRQLAIRIVEKFLRTEFEGGRHQRRVEKIAAIEA